MSTCASQLLLMASIVGGVASICYFSAWWFQPGIRGDLLLYIALTVSFYFYMFRYLGYWLLFLKIQPNQPPDPLPGLTVDVMTTAAPGEPIEMTQKCLLALKNLTYPHATYLLDDSHNPALKAWCADLQIHYIERQDKHHAKCGNVNNGLRHSTGEFVLIVDPDHVLKPRYLDRVLGHFRDPQVGFVQTAQAYYNQYTSFVAQAGAEQTYLFYGPVLQGLQSINANLVIGTNCTFRRSALESIGLYQPGLAEDLHTSMALHSQGWKGAYVPEILGRGLTPADLTTFLHQQLKWSRGVMELMLHDYWRYAKAWSWPQRLSYLLNMTYYLESVMMVVHLSIPILYLWTQKLPVKVTLQDFWLHITPWLVCSLVIFILIQNWLCSPKERGLMWRGMLMQYLCFPAHLLGIVCALVGRDIPYLATAKNPLKRYPFHLLLPQILLFVLFAVYSLHHNLIENGLLSSTGMTVFLILNVFNILVAMGVSLVSHEKMVKDPLYLWWHSKFKR